MKITEILKKSQQKYELLNDVHNLEISDIALDSRLVKKGTIFFALPGKSQNGDKFIQSAIDNGATIIVANANNNFSHPAIICQDVHKLLVEFLQIFYAPLPQNLYAITGTNGKTSIANMSRQILEFIGKKSASIGTLGVVCSENLEDKLVKSSLTTPDIITLYKNLKILKENNINDVVIEASSIGLEQGRLDGLKFCASAFSNFTQDHLDYHGTMEEYFASKMILFQKLAAQNSSAILNADISDAAKIKEISSSNNLQIIDYGKEANILKITQISDQKITINYQNNNFEFSLNLAGNFQIYNALCALGMLLSQHNLNKNQLENLLTKFELLNSAPGRMQQIATVKGAKIFIDFAHSPDALENILISARPLTKNRLIILFGCGGDRDNKKRAIMGKIASNLADLIIVTDDNPRTENSATIRSEILNACNKDKTIEIDGRALAIQKAISLLQEGDILILAGKGHEKYQIIGTKKINFDEEKIVKDELAKLS